MPIRFSKKPQHTREIRVALGRLNLHTIALEHALLSGSLSKIEEEAGAVEEHLIEGMRLSNYIGSNIKLRRAWIQQRSTSLRTLEMVRNLLDESLKALIALIDEVEHERRD